MATGWLLKLDFEAMLWEVCTCLTWCCAQIQIITVLWLNQQDGPSNLVPVKELKVPRPKVLHILLPVSAWPMDFRNLHLQKEHVLGKIRKNADHMGKDLQQLLMTKFWDRHRCGMEEMVGKRFTEAPNKMLERCGCLGTRSRAMPCHSTLTPSEGKERKGSLVLRSC